FVSQRDRAQPRADNGDEDTQNDGNGADRSERTKGADRDQKLKRLVRSWSDWDRSQHMFQQDAPLYWRVITHQLLFAQRSWRAKSYSAAERTLGHVDVNRRAAAVDVWDFVRDAQDPQFILTNVSRRVRRNQPINPTVARPARAAEIESPQDWFAHYKDALPANLRQAATLDRVRNLRDLAENATIGSLGTWPAVRQLTTQADDKRRLYEDRLFTGVRAEDREADRVAAQGLYQQALDVQQVVSQSRQLVNKLYCLLPELARWSAFRCRVAAGDDPDLQQTVALLEALEEQLGKPSADPGLPATGLAAIRLPEASFLHIEQTLLVLFDEARSLDKASNAVGAGDVGQVDMLRSLTDRTTGRLASVLDDLNGRASQLSELTEFQWNDYRDLGHLLQCPVFTGDDRRRFLEKIDEMSRQLNKQYIDRAKSLEMQSSRKLKHAHVVVLRMWRAMWALQTAMLASPEFSIADAEVVLWLQCWQDRGRLKPSHDELLELVERIRSRFVEQKIRLVARTESQELPVELDNRRDVLLRIDRWARVLHASDAAQCLGRQVRPTVLLRKFQIAELCAGLAERYLDDYWKDFYPQATASCLSVAKDVPGFGPRIQQLNNRLQSRRQAVLRVPQEQVNFGTDKRKTLRLSPAADAQMPSGRAAIWIAIDDRRLVRRQDGEQTRREWAIGGEQPRSGSEFPLERQEITTADCPISVKADCLVFFRGHNARDYNRFKPLSIQAADLNPCPSIPDRLKYLPPDKFGRAVVLGTDRRSLVFVLDCSNSMLDTEVVDRWTPAIKALRRVVGNLANRKTAGWPHNVGLMAFGHRLRKIGDSAQVQINPGWEWRKWNLKKPGADLASDFEMLLRIQPLREGDEIRFDNLLDENREGRTGPLLKPWGYTPLYGAMNEASKQFGNGQAGTLVVITDGIDTVSPSRTLERVQKSLADNHVNLYMVGYLLQEKEKNKYRRLCADSDGNFVEVDRREQMLTVLT
ncbi:MAG: vWA domain-containing protein, partial [Planctomycetaceae bacterium]